MTTFPRVAGAMPRTATPLEGIEGSRIWSQAGKAQLHGSQQMGRTWDEVYGLLDLQNPSVRAFLETVNRSLREGLFWDVQHPYWHVRKGVGGGSPLTHSPQNTIAEPENLAGATWFDLATAVTMTAGQIDPFGGFAAYLLNDTDAVNQAQGRGTLLNFTADGEKCAAFFVKAGNSGGFHFGIWDATASAWRMQIRGTFTSGVPGSFVTVAGSGMIAPVEDWGNGWYRIAFTGTGCIAANANQLRLRPTPAITGAETGTAYFFGANGWNATTQGPYRGPTAPGPLGVELSQEGGWLYVRGAPVSTSAWLRAGDLIQVPGLPVVLDVMAQVDTNSNGGTRIPINPPTFSGQQLADGIGVTVDPTAIMFRAVIAAVADYPVVAGTLYLDAGMTITWREQGA